MEKLLTEICTPKQWKTISTSKLLDEGYTVYGANGIIGYYNEYTHEEPTLMITCRGATCGTLNISKPFSYINGNAMALDNLDEDIDIKYLYYYLKNRGLKDTISGSAQPQITRIGLANVKINYPNIETQKKIVGVLDKTQELIDKRKEQIEALDELVKSRFIEMFGNPATNPKGWKITTIGDITTDVRYGTSKSSVDGGKYPYLRMNNITYKGGLDLQDLKYIDIDDEELEKCIVRKGDVLFNRTNSAELIGKTCVFNLDEPMIIAGYIIRVRLNDDILPIYLSMFLNSDYGKKLLRGMAKGAVNQANINAQELKSIKISVPPIELQNQFADFINQVDKLKSQMETSLKELEDNFNSLMQKAFKGELF